MCLPPRSWYLLPQVAHRRSRAGASQSLGSTLYNVVAGVTWKTVRRIALSLPEVEEVEGDRPWFRVRGKGFAWKSRERDGGTLAIRVDRDEKPLMLEGRPDLYFETPHYVAFPRCSSISRRST
jgi:hypothetical protein